MQRGELASRTRSIVDEMLWAQFHFGLSVCSVKVVRHKKGEYFVWGCGKRTNGQGSILAEGLASEEYRKRPACVGARCSRDSMIAEQSDLFC
jgi:hypothetical protein